MPTSCEVCLVKLSCNLKGPIIIDGSVEITDKYGLPLASDYRKKMLVLCGYVQSKNKPFFDGTHDKSGEDKEDDISNGG